MLVLSRKEQQSIKIGDDIEITVVSVEGDQVKLGINAPKNVDIHRKEVYVAIQEENAQASQFDLNILNELAEKNSESEK
ncbi:carbon storage regulator CsrA [Alkalicoccus chagannorensis]|uniref:carbon storage regulator CsrA n=1 Tax=Alkalicoccus chagannorensis TaxID=427072 RepID=UPI0003FD1DC8|nr:carbon storage regulator CsrA [Alkalicoccus chagannorensis]